MFPSGLPGLALLLLRMSAVLALLSNSHLAGNQLSVWISAGAILVSLTLSIGWLTPISAATALALHVFVWAHLDHLGVLGVPGALVVLLDLLALAMIGPGAYSIDGYRYGRRMLVLPPG
jgi:hypothetical protein